MVWGGRLPQLIVSTLHKQRGEWKLFPPPYSLSFSLRVFIRWAASRWWENIHWMEQNLFWVRNCIKPLNVSFLKAEKYSELPRKATARWWWWMWHVQPMGCNYRCDRSCLLHTCQSFISLGNCRQTSIKATPTQSATTFTFKVLHQTSPHTNSEILAVVASRGGWGAFA